MGLKFPRVSQGSPKVLPSGSPCLGGTSAGFSAKVPKVLSRFFQVVLPLLVARLLDSRLRFPRFSQGSPKVLPSGSPSLGGTSAGFLAKVAQGSPKVLPSGSLSLGGTCVGFSAKVPKVLPRFSQMVLLLLVAHLLDSRLRFPRFSLGSPRWFFFSWWHVCWIIG